MENEMGEGRRLDALLSMLSQTEYTSGERLCEQLGMTRAAIWKRMEKLRAEGYQIISAGKRGYRLETVRGSLLPGYIAAALQTRWAGRGEILYAQEMTSTSAVLKDHARKGAPNGSIALCEEQTQGRGRMQRSWECEPGQNLMHSLLLRPNLPLEQAPLCTLAAACAMAKAIEATVPGIKTGIKWPNDILIGGRKCVGILSELAADMDGIQFVVMGVGVNVNQREFAGELAQRATSLVNERAQDAPPIDRAALLCAYLLYMEQAMDALMKEGLPGILQEYGSRSVTIGSRVRVIGADSEFLGMADTVDETGALLVTDESGQKRRVLSGDVSVRGVMGYV